MATDYWIKLYHEILDDPKVATLPDHLWRRMIELFLVAGRLGGNEKTGELPSTKEIAWLLRVSVDDLELDLDQLARIGIISKTPGGWLVVNFQERQDAATPTERWRAHRDRKRKQQYYSNDNQTKSLTETETESESEEDDDDGEKTEKTPNLQSQSNIFTLYEQNIGILTPIISEKLKAAEKDYPPDWFPWAFGQAVSNNARSWAYIDACLKNRRDGKDHIPRARSPSINNKDPVKTNDQIVAEVARDLAKGLATNARK